MKATLKAFMKQPATRVGIAAAFMFQIIFSVIWMTGYSGVNDRMEQLKVAVINDDQLSGQQIAAGLLNGLPFEMIEMYDINVAQKELNERRLQMIVHIPADFSQRASAGEGHAVIQYWMNESNPVFVKSIMSGAASQITDMVNKQAVQYGIQATLGQMNVAAEQAGAAAQSLSQRVATEVQSMNTVQGMNNQMVPLMLVLASFVGAMVMGMNLEQASAALRHDIGRWERFAARCVINVSAAVLVSLVGAALLAVLGGQMEAGFMQLWMFQLLFLTTFIFVAQMFLYLFGMAGMVLNIMLLSAQLVSSGTIVPRELLPDFYFGLSTALPATYAVNGSMNILFGGVGAGADAIALGIIAVAAIIISTATVWVKREAVREHVVQQNVMQ